MQGSLGWWLVKGAAVAPLLALLVRLQTELRMAYQSCHRCLPPQPILQRVLAGKGVGADAAWAALLSRPLFAAASDGGSASLGHLLDIWVEQQHLLWKVGAVVFHPWLLTCKGAKPVACNALII